jgi:hypothetical protein
MLLNAGPMSDNLLRSHASWAHRGYALRQVGHVPKATHFKNDGLAQVREIM